MQTARMDIYIEAPIERVWDVLTDYAGYARIPQVRNARVVRTGREHPAGVGAVREVEVMGSTFQEEIVEFEPPRRLAYRITESRPLTIAHDIGRVELTARGTGTEIHWTTRLAVDVPVLGPLLTPVVRLLAQNTFNEILLWLKDDLERKARS